MAIKARLDHHSAAAEDGDSQRNAPRRALWLETSGFFAGTGETNVTIHNISATGLLLETSVPLVDGEQLAIDLPETEGVIATVVWRSERLYGCAFTAPLRPATLAAAQLQALAPGGITVPSARAAPLAGAAAGEGLGARLNRLRREAGLTLADVAGTLGVSKPTVWAWEKGKARPLPERLDAIAAALGVAPDMLDVAATSHEIDDVVADCRMRIAEVCGTKPGAVRIMIEL